MAEYDLSKSIGKYLDRHLYVLICEFLQENNVYPKEEILKAELELLSKTSLVGFAMEVYKNLNNTQDVPQAMNEQQAQLEQSLKKLEEESAPLLALIEKESQVQALRNDHQFTLPHLEQNFNIKENHVDSLYKLAKLQYECGQYNEALKFLAVVRDLTKDQERALSALWGQLASEILMDSMDQASKSLAQLKEVIESKSFMSPLKQLQQRTWLLHWSLFVFFKHQPSRTGIVDLCFHDKYMNAIQTTCPYILRYLAAAVVINKKKRNYLKELVRVIDQESYRFQDPVTQFLEALYVNFDFEAAEQKLKSCEKALANDYFLQPYKDEFVENARLFIFETYCKIHNTIDIKMLSEKLSLSGEEGERWIVNLIRNARLDAKIDSAQDQVILGGQAPSAYQQLIDKTKGLSLRSIVLSNNIERSRGSKHHNTNTAANTTAQQQQQQQTKQQ
jgi:translation initiation factor 3 subunit E